MFKRRDVLKIIAGAGVTLPFTEKNPVLNPGAFAGEVAAYIQSEAWIGLADDNIDLTECIAPQEYAKYIQAREAFLDAYPDLRSGGINLFSEFEEAAMGWCMNGYSEGVQHGAALEHARQTIIGPSHLCPDCGGAGVVREWARGGYGPVVEPGPCGNCGGRGTVHHD